MPDFPLTALLERNATRFKDQRVLLCGELLDAAVLGTLRTAREVFVHCDHYPTAARMAAALGHTLDHSLRQCVQEGVFTLCFGDCARALEQAQGREFDLMVVQLCKSKQYTEVLLHSFAPLLRAQATVLIAGENRQGGRSAAALLGSNPSCKADTARKCTLFESTVSAPLPVPAAVPAVTCHIGQRSLTLEQSATVFSAGRLDEGTSHLLDYLMTLPPGGTALDLGCGCGVLGLALSSQGWQVTCSDASAAALALTQRNAALNGLEISLCAADMLDDMPQYALIAVNPPFHQGVSRQSAPTLRMLSAAAQHLKPGGMICVVGNVFLNYERALQQSFGKVRTVFKNNAFSVCCATREI
ncbi:MAG: class I SAM-dependent methyltransferase [Succinivibrio sp.]|nr:class I SAM-dependent methyltransferase [Succinivibrio sp.]